MALFKNLSFIDFNALPEDLALPSIRLHKQIAAICANLKNRCGFHGVGSNLLLNQGGTLALTDDAYVYINYLQNGLDKIDIKWRKEYLPLADHDLAPQIYSDPTQQSLCELLATHFQHYHPYRVVRRSAELTLIYAGILPQPIDHHQTFFQQTQQQLAEFMVYFYDNLLEECVSYLPPLKYTRFFNDAAYRKQFILGKLKSPLLITATNQLSDKELECLYWASRGKTSEEIALILCKSEHTIRKQLANVIKKLDATNIAHAIYLALSQGLIC